MGEPAGGPRQFLATVDRQCARRNRRSLDDNPSLKTILDEVMASTYRYARRKAAIETDLPESDFPARCPWRFAEVMDEEFWPR
jgi:Domain of unknown function DUF29